MLINNGSKAAANMVSLDRLTDLPGGDVADLEAIKFGIVQGP